MHPDGSDLQSGSSPSSALSRIIWDPPKAPNARVQHREEPPVQQPCGASETENRSDGFPTPSWETLSRSLRSLEIVAWVRRPRRAAAFAFAVV
jgi:hypothetical protein